VTADDVEAFRTELGRRFGLNFDDGKLALLDEVLRRRLDATGTGARDYLARLASDPTWDRAKLAEELTVGETYFFRNPDQFTALVQAVVPVRKQARATMRTLRVLSAGCATGDEAYSLAIAIRGALPDPSWSISIRAVDVNPAALARARLGRFSAWALRGTPSEVQQSWFRPDGREFVLDNRVRTSVELELRNLADEDPDLWRPDTYDVVFCRNVIMYFTPETARAVVARIGRALAPGGYLFLGHAETLRGLSSAFHLCHTHGTFYYQRRESYAPETAPQHATAEAPLVPINADDASWVDTIRRASERVQALTASTTDAGESSPRPRSAHAAPPDLAHALGLLREERFADAFAALTDVSTAHGRDPSVLMLRAVLLVQRGELAQAEHACRELLSADELEAGAHYVLALCREGSGDRAAAAHHDQIAAYLDPGFAMPRMHLGLLARRAGDLDTARRELTQATLLLEREDASRILLFGGGFPRDALIALCRTELAAVGATSP
jgi:chemotaxis protein methyltransferase CheR